jgi:HPt (histidine-containing phosphotransfer) domain-containing protein
MGSPDSSELRALQLDYLSSCRESLVQLRRHAKGLANSEQFKSSFPILLYISHQLKGSGGTLGFPRLSELAAAISAELNLFLGEGEVRPQPAELSEAIVRLAGEIEQELTIEEERLSAEESA